MRFFTSVAFAAFSAIAAAQSNSLGFTSAPTSVQAGSEVTIKYNAQNLNEPATITLRKGDPDNLQTVQVIASSATNGTFNWIVPDYLENADDYALEISQGDDNNYSGEFSLSGANPSAVSTAQAATASLSSAQSALTSSYAQSASVSSIQAIIASYNSSLYNLTAPATANTSTTAVPAVGTGASMANSTTMVRNATMSSATLSSTGGSASNGASATSAGASNTAGGVGSAGSTSAGSSSQASASSTSKAGANAVNAVSGGSTLALVLAAVVGVLI